ncbi:uncharacterized protein LOC143285732 [Babylonia areolata]|uniref:uncharacterized protein LOC143285732 n=1 Tax=Babylonia areolata TaxID=304850 RepID=UPI003FCF251E
MAAFPSCAGFGLFVFLLLAAAHVGSLSVRKKDYWCRYSDMFVREGYLWKGRCHNCTCVKDKGFQCTGKECTLPYHPDSVGDCAEWEEDGCCCKAEGCKLSDGTIVPLGAVIPPPNNGHPCQHCRCGGGATRYGCFIYECPVCLKYAPRLPGACCAQCAGE